ncbi:type II toxin-antitoxin system death-on-curing family toxin [Erythrobacter cryptus]|uniref:type II toxin-antitoxin system death-on-curing family toxin n=1 Tax=Erythrobacter cryptus TaxID=196588 RepID=UPI00041DA87E|nr:type II toxin-antitoxin system death-on-curing family toxin [Erythrobacter cryptus]
MTEPVWLREDVVRAIHRRQIAEHGGLDGLRDAGLLASALERPKALLAYGEPPPDLAALTAACAWGIARNHPFVDGNKRVALVVLRLFLRLNGHDLIASAAEKYEMIMRLAAGTLDEAELAEWVRGHLATCSR